MTKQKDLKGKNIFMVKDGQYVKWDGSDVSHLLIKEQVTLARKYHPDNSETGSAEKMHRINLAIEQIRKGSDQP